MNSGSPSAAIIMIVVSALLFSMMDAGTKYLGGFMSVVLVLWSRYLIQAGIMAIVLAHLRCASSFRTAHPGFQCLRAILLLAISTLAFYSMRSMPLAEFTAIMMLSPVLVTATAAWLMKQSIGRLRWALVWGGFVGTLIVIRPGSGLFGAVVLVPIIAMLISTCYSLVTSRLAVLENPYTTQFYTGLVGALLLTPMAWQQSGEMLRVFAATGAGVVALLLLIGVLGTVGHLLLIMAFSRAGAAALMPFTYAQIGFAAVMSWLVFQHAPDLWAWLGMLTIAASGGATAWLNLRQASAARRVESI
jgi:drug/metabolite transporter (DMT)-like permease